MELPLNALPQLRPPQSQRPAWSLHIRKETQNKIIMSKIDKLFKKDRDDFHTNSDGTWGTDDHDADILKGLAVLITAITTAVATIIGSKKK